MSSATSAAAPRRLVAAVAVAAAALLTAPAAFGAGPISVTPNWALHPAGSSPIHGRDAVGLAVNPRNHRHIVAMYADWASLWCETAVSRNGGRTWRARRLKAPEGFVWPPCTVGGHLANHVDGGIAFGRGDTVYVAFASARVTEGSGIDQGRSVLVARSTNGGRSFSTGRIALEGGADADEGPDHILPKIAVRPGRRGQGDTIYLVAGSSELDHEGVQNEDTILTVSRDSGRTWAAPRALDGPDVDAIEQSQPVLGAGGDLYIAWRTRGRGAERGRSVPEGTVVVARSRDGGRTFTTSTAAGVRGYTYEGPPEPPFTRVRSFTASTFPRLAADRRNGNLYLVYGNGGRPTTGDTARASDHFIHPDMDVWFQRSTDGGRTWSDARQLNDRPEVFNDVTQTRHPNVSVARNGRVDVVWHDRRHWYRGCTHTHSPCLEARLGDTYYSFSEDGGRSFSRDRRLTDRSMNNDVGFDYRFGAYWDYGPFAVPIRKKRLLVAWMDSRQGNYETDTMSLYLARVKHGRHRMRTAHLLAGRRVRDVGVALSRWGYPAGPEAVLGGTFATRPWSRVVIVSERDEAGALAAGVLARANLGPVLAVPSGGLTPQLSAEVSRLQSIGAYLIGGEGSVSSEVARDLASTGIPSDQIVRLAGDDEAGTAALIAQAMDRRSDEERAAGKPAFDAAIIVNPATDAAYSASVLAAARRLPILFVGSTLPAATARALDELDIDRTLVVGDSDAVGGGVVSELPNPQRLAGRSVLNTSRAVAAEARRRSVPDNIVYATPRRMDAALLGASAGRTGGLQLLARPRAARRAIKGMGLRSRVDRLIVVKRRSGR